MRGVCILITLVVSNAAPALADFDSENLKGARGVPSYAIFLGNFDDTAANACNLSGDGVRAATVNVLLPAGIAIASGSQTPVGQIRITGPTLKFASGLCATSLTFQVLRFVVYSWHSENVVGLAELFTKTEIISSAQAIHRGRVNGEVAEFAREFVGFWREANPDLARAQPPENIPGLGISKRPASGSLTLNRTQVTDLQTRLHTLGFYTGPSDGILGPATRAALISFQARNGLAPTGAIDWNTLQTLFRQ